MEAAKNFKSIQQDTISAAGQLGCSTQIAKSSSTAKTSKRQSGIMFADVCTTKNQKKDAPEKSTRAGLAQPHSVLHRHQMQAHTVAKSAPIPASLELLAD